MKPLLSVENLTFTDRYQSGLFGKTAEFNLGPVNFQINAGETLAIVGTNGSGKSLLAKILVGANKPHGGSICLNGEPLNETNSKQQTQNIRMIFQHSKDSLNPGITLGSILEEPLILNTQLNEQQREAKIEDMLIKVGLLREHKFFYRHMLSYGQRQRIALARALILDPQIIVADEPFAALDPSVRSQTINLLLKLQRELGLGFIVISHNLGIIRHISDQVLLVRHGKVVESGNSEDVFTNPQHEYTQKLVKAHQTLAYRS